ncbi:MAG: hypothetical protein N4A54_02795 [Peptostreptococcaceae bacterium]|nr:hypothetical protein [Peptostreptococcaceae bacterium]
MRKNIIIFLLILNTLSIITNVVLYNKCKTINDDYKEYLSKEVQKVYEIHSKNSTWEIDGFIGLSNNTGYLKINNIKYISNEKKELKSISKNFYIRNIQTQKKILDLFNSNEEGKNTSLIFEKDKTTQKIASKFNHSSNFDLNNDSKVVLETNFIGIDGKSTTDEFILDIRNYDLKPYIDLTNPNLYK